MKTDTIPVGVIFSTRPLPQIYFYLGIKKLKKWGSSAKNGCLELKHKWDPLKKIGNQNWRCPPSPRYWSFEWKNFCFFLFYFLFLGWRGALIGKSQRIFKMKTLFCYMFFVTRLGGPLIGTFDYLDRDTVFPEFVHDLKLCPQTMDFRFRN